MRRTRAAGTCFALHGGYPVEETPFVHLTPHAEVCVPGWSGALLVLAEPLEPAPGATDAAVAAIDEIREALLKVDAADAIMALSNAFQAANERLYRDNTNRSIRRRIYLGMTAVVLCGEDLFVAQTPPGQLLVRQDDALYAFPLLESWKPDFQPSKTYDLPNPLGLRFQVDPDVFYSRAAPGDLVLALSSNIARCVASLGEDFRLLSDVEDSLERVVEACERHFVSTGHGAVVVLPDVTSVSLPRLPRELQTFDFQAWESSGTAMSEDIEHRKWDTAPLDPAASTVQTGDAHELAGDWLDRGSSRQHGPGFAMPFSGAADHDDTDDAHPQAFVLDDMPSPLVGRYARQRDADELTRFRPDQRAVWFEALDRRFADSDRAATYDAFDDRSGHLAASRPGSPGHRRARGSGPLELLAGLLLSLTAAVVGVWQVTKRDRPIHGPLDDGSFGLPRLQRWDESYRPPRMQRLRSRFPRFEVSRFVVVIFVALLVAVGAFFYYSHSSSQIAINSSEYAAVIQQVETRLAGASGQSDPAVAYATLLDAQATLDAASAMDSADVDQVSALQAQITAEIARVTGSQRLSNVQVLGGVPSAPSGVAPRLISGGGNLFLLSDRIYQVDTFTASLVLLLSPGDLINGEPVGVLRGATWREDRLVAIDATRSYAFDSSRGAWGVENLGTFDAEGHTNIATAEAFDRNLYLLTPVSGQILKFQAGAYEGQPEDWTGGVANAELKSGIDLAIDGHVLVLLEDGRILDFFRSRLEATMTPQIIPPLDRPSAIVVTSTGTYIYLLNQTDGRIVRLSREGAVIQQFTSAESDAMPILSGAVDLSIDESAGLAYILANDTIYTVRIPSAPASQ